MNNWSLDARFLLAAAVAALFGVASGVAATTLTGSPWTGGIFAAALTTPITVMLMRRVTRPVNRILEALNDSMASFKDGDFSTSLGTARNDELGQLVKSFNDVGDVLRRERQDLFHR